MKKDLQNVVMTFGAIALVLSVGTYAHYSDADVEVSTTELISIEAFIDESTATSLEVENVEKEIVQEATTTPEPEPVELPKPKVVPVKTVPVVVPPPPVKTTTTTPPPAVTVATTTKTTDTKEKTPSKPSRESRAS